MPPPCAANLGGQTQSSRGDTWRYYRCPNGHGSIRADTAETHLLDRVRAGVLPSTVIDEARAALAERVHALPRQQRAAPAAHDPPRADRATL